MDFTEAMWHLVKGDKIRRKCWRKDIYIYKPTEGVAVDHILDSEGNIYYVFHIENDWELYEE
jgi:hypothetical protein